MQNQCKVILREFTKCCCAGALIFEYMNISRGLGAQSMSTPATSWCPLGTNITAGHRPPTACFPSPMPLAKAKCGTRAQAKIDGIALANKCFVCGYCMDAWEKVNRGFACPKCTEQIHYQCSAVCTLCHVDFCPLHCAPRKHNCTAAAAAAPPEKQSPAACGDSCRLHRRHDPVA